ncbi:MAG: hypothetical protein ACTSRZ_01360 [Promethearchaeota archaeon]
MILIISLPISWSLVAIISVCGIFIAYYIIKRPLKTNLGRMFKYYILSLIISICLIIVFIISNFTAPKNIFICYISNWFFMEFVVITLFFLKQFSNGLKYPKEKIRKSKKIDFYIAILFMIILSLPQNQWCVSNINYSSGIFISPLSLSLVFIYAIFTISLSYKQCKKVKDHVADPYLKEVYKWIYRSIKSNYLPLPGFFLYITSLIIPLNLFYIWMILIIIMFIFGAIGFLFSIYGFLLVMSFPKVIYKKIYKEYSPMWLEKENEEQIKKSIEKLKELFFENDI